MSGAKILHGLREAIDYARGDESKARVRVVRVPDNVDVRAIRGSLKMRSIRMGHQGQEPPES